MNFSGFDKQLKSFLRSLHTVRMIKIKNRTTDDFLFAIPQSGCRHGVAIAYPCVVRPYREVKVGCIVVQVPISSLGFFQSFVDYFAAHCVALSLGRHVDPAVPGRRCRRPAPRCLLGSRSSWFRLLLVGHNGDLTLVNDPMITMGCLYSNSSIRFRESCRIVRNSARTQLADGRLVFEATRGGLRDRSTLRHPKQQFVRPGPLWVVC